jgi:hypothetical protein
MNIHCSFAAFFTDRYAKTPVQQQPANVIQLVQRPQQPADAARQPNVAKGH